MNFYISSVVVVALVSACSGNDDGKALADPVPYLELPESVEVTVEFGVTTLIPVSIENSGTDLADGSASITNDFSLPEGRFTLDAGVTKDLIVEVTPQTYEAIEGTLTLEIGTESWSTDLFVTVNADVDGDGFITMAAGGDDCDDNDDSVHPGSAEVCDDVDQNCDGQVDEDLLTLPFYADSDGDGFGDPSVEVEACRAPDGHVETNTDCDDADPDAHPGAMEIWYDDIDQDCAGGSDHDQDMDGEEAETGLGFDCDDLDPNTYPGAVELDDGLDNDCDTYLDEDIINPGDLVFTEVFTNPQTAEVGRSEWVEVRNVSNTHVEIYGNILITFGDVENNLQHGIIPPDGVYLLIASASSAVNGGIDNWTEAAIIPNQSTFFQINGPQGVVDTVDLTGWAMTPGRSMELAADKQNSMDNDLESSWCEGVSLFGAMDGDRGTPGVILPPCP